MPGHEGLKLEAHVFLPLPPEFQSTIGFQSENGLHGSVPNPKEV